MGLPPREAVAAAGLLIAFQFLTFPTLTGCSSTEQFWKEGQLCGACEWLIAGQRCQEIFLLWTKVWKFAVPTPKIQSSSESSFCCFCTHLRLPNHSDVWAAMTDGPLIAKNPLGTGAKRGMNFLQMALLYRNKCYLAGFPSLDKNFVSSVMCCSVWKKDHSACILWLSLLASSLVDKQ